LGLFRFVLALNVMIYHIVEIPSIGQFAVYSFFILSGFLMTTIMNDKYGHSIIGFKKYAINRFLRLYPLYWLLSLLLLIMLYVTSSQFASLYHHELGIPSGVSNILSNLTLIYPAFYPIEETPRLAPASWALTIELFYYLLIGLGISKTRKRTFAWFGLSIVMTIVWNVYHQTISLNYGNFLTASVPFSLGALLYYYQASVFNSLKKLPLFNLFIGSLFIGNLALVSSSKFFAAEQWWKFDLIGSYLNLILSALVIIVLFNFKPQAQFKNVDKYFGDLSYPIYLLHWGVACFISWCFFSEPIKGISWNGLEVFSLSLFLTIVISTLINMLANEPIEALRRKIKG